MQKSVTPGRKKFRLFALLTTLLSGLGAAGALLAGVSPAIAADLVHEPNAQIAVFMVPLTLLVMVLLFEAARHVWRGKLPMPAPVRRRHSVWTSRPNRR